MSGALSGPFLSAKYLLHSVCQCSTCSGNLLTIWWPGAITCGWLRFAEIELEVQAIC